MSALSFWVVNPNDSLSKRWESLLQREGWPAVRQKDFSGFVSALEPNRAGLLLLDWDALRSPQVEQIRKFKAGERAVSIILTSSEHLAANRIIEALEAGADDHLLHSVDDRIFLAKLKAHLRRMLPHLTAALEVLRSPEGGIKLDRSRQLAWIKDGRDWVEVSRLTPTEFQFLALFLEQPGKVLERRFILETVWREPESPILPGTVDKHIESLRRKLGRRGGMIRTVYGVGYALREGK